MDLSISCYLHQVLYYSYPKLQIYQTIQKTIDLSSNMPIVIHLHYAFLYFHLHCNYAILQYVSTDHLAKVPQLSIMIIYNGTQSILIAQIRIILTADNLTQKIKKKAYFLFVIKRITRSKKIYCIGMSLKIREIMHYMEQDEV